MRRPAATRPRCVQRLFAVADGQRDEDGGHAHRSHLADSGGTGPCQQQVRRGVDGFHAVHVLHLPVARRGERLAVRVVHGLAAAGDVQGLHPGVGKRSHRRGEGPVDALGARGAAGDDQCGFVRVQAERLPRAGPGCGAVQAGDFRPHGHAHMPRAAEFGRGEGDGHVAAEAGADTVCQARAGVGLVDHDRDLPAPGGKVHRGAHIAADAHQDVGAGLVQDGTGLLYRTGHPAGEPEQVHGGPARERDPADGGQIQPGGRNQPGFHPARGAHCQELHSGQRLPQGTGDGQERADVSGGSAAGKDHGQRRLGVHKGLFTLSCGSWMRGLWPQACGRQVASESCPGLRRGGRRTGPQACRPPGRPARPGRAAPNSRRQPGRT